MAKGKFETISWEGGWLEDIDLQEYRQDLSWLVDIVENLREPGRTVVEMKFWGQATFRQIGKEIGMGPGSVYYWYKKMLREIEERIKEQNEDD